MSKNRLYSTPKNSPNFNSSIVLRSQRKPKEAKKVADSVQQDAKKVNTGKTIKNGLNSDSDSSGPSTFVQLHSKFDIRLPYSRAEDEVIVEFVLNGENIFKTSSISLWKKLELKKENPKRTYQSLKNRFLRNIRPKLFTTYSGLIKNKETVDRILSKFPELKNTVGGKPTLTSLAKRNSCLPKVPLAVENQRPKVAKKKSREERPEKTSIRRECNTVSSQAVTEEPNGSKPQPESQPLISSSDIFPATTNPRKVVCKNGSILVTVEVSQRKDSQTKTGRSEQEGIYQKYLKYKRNNVINPCSRCGRGGFEGYQSADSDSDDEGRLVIASPLRTPSRQNSPRTDHSDGDEPGKKRSRKEDCPAVSSSPSLLGGTAQAEEDPAGKEEASDLNQKRKSQKEASQTLFTDEDLETLYWNTISFCRTLTDCESADEEEKKEAGEVEKDVELQCRSSSSCSKGKGSVGFFFANLMTESHAIENGWQISERFIFQNKTFEENT